jgi:hypothetical protein
MTTQRLQKIPECFGRTNIKYWRLAMHSSHRGKKIDDTSFGSPGQDRTELSPCAGHGGGLWQRRFPLLCQHSVFSSFWSLFEYRSLPNISSWHVKMQNELVHDFPWSWTSHLWSQAFPCQRKKGHLGEYSDRLNDLILAKLYASMTIIDEH